MAEGVAVKAGQVIVSALIESLVAGAEKAKEEQRLEAEVEHEIDRLTSQLNVIKGVLQDAEYEQVKSESINAWLRELREVIYDAEDVLDAHATDLALQPPPPTRSKNKINFSCVLPCFTGPPPSTTEVVHGKLANIRNKLESVFGMRQGLVGRRPPSRWRETTSKLARHETMVLVGRDEVKSRMVKILLGKTINHTIINVPTVVPVVGVGGIGKTSLARLVFNDRQVQDHFQLTMWVCVSESFDLVRLTAAIAASAAGYPNSPMYDKFSTLEAIQRKLGDLLANKCFLLVLDDAWNQESSLWRTLLSPLEDGSSESMVIVTTRSNMVANAIPGMNKMDLILLEGLTLEQTWSVFKYYAFGQVASEERSIFEDIGLKIVKKLKGSPLAAKSIGSLLRTNLDFKFWHRILGSELWTLSYGEREEDGVLYILQLSYQHLPPQLKQCFSYCSLFPKDSIFTREELLHLWMGHQLIHSKGATTVEYSGMRCFDDLLNSLFFEKIGNNTYVMHDLIHDVAQFVSEDEFLWINDAKPPDYKKATRHVSIADHTLDLKTLENISSCRKLRTMALHFPLGFGRIPNVDDVLDHWLRSFSCLRVLRLRESNIKELPISIGDLKHLRCIDLSWTPLENLPDSFCKLYNLQVLNLKACFELHILPVGFSKLINLRHVQAKSSLLSNLSGIGNLKCLQQLHKFQVRTDVGGKIEELKNLNNLNAELHIENLENVENEIEACNARLGDKEGLEMLLLQWVDRRGVKAKLKPAEVEDAILESLQPSSLLRRLTIKCHDGNKPPSWMQNTHMPYLKTIRLQDCSRWKVVPCLGYLGFLKILRMSGMNSVKRIGPEFCGDASITFPLLEELSFSHMSSWEEWSCNSNSGTTINYFPRLRVLHLINCPCLIEMPPISPSTTEMKIINVGLTSLPMLSSSPTTSPCLSSLYIRHCGSLRSLNVGLLTQDLSNLEQLQIIECNGLERPPDRGFMHFEALRTIWIAGCPDLKHINGGLPSFLCLIWFKSCIHLDSALLVDHLKGLTNLVSLNIHDCPNITSLSQHMLSQLTSLQQLSIQDCHSLASVQFPTFEFMKKMTIANCPNLKVASDLSTHPSTPSHQPYELCIKGINNPQLIVGSIKALGVDRLHILRISECSNISTLQDGGELEGAFLSLSSLQQLDISSCMDLQRLQETTSPPLIPSSIKCLNITNCPRFESLQSTELKNLSSLEMLKIQNCPQLQSLPDTGFPRSLQYLRITRCPLVNKFYAQCPTWDISHVPKVDIF